MEENQEVAKQPEQVKLTKVEEARQLVERMEKANEDHRALLEREENIRSEKIVSGTAMAGQLIKSQEEIEKERSQKLADEIINAFR